MCQLGPQKVYVWQSTLWQPVGRQSLPKVARHAKSVCRSYSLCGVMPRQGYAAAYL